MKGNERKTDCIFRTEEPRGFVREVTTRKKEIRSLMESKGDGTQPSTDPDDFIMSRCVAMAAES